MLIFEFIIKFFESELTLKTAAEVALIIYNLFLDKLLTELNERGSLP